MTREELEERYLLIIDKYSSWRDEYDLTNELQAFRNACIRYGINKICEEYIDENGMCLGKYKSAEEVIKELDDGKV